MSDATGKRYATALFELAKEKKALEAIESQVDELAHILADSQELVSALSSPVVGRTSQENIVSAISKKAKFHAVLANTLNVMAARGRLGLLESVIASFREMVTYERNEVVAEVATAQKMTAAQLKSLTSVLTKKFGKTVTIETTIDESLVGGMVVKVGSTMIDSSVKGKLSKFHNAMKEVG